MRDKALKKKLQQLHIPQYDEYKLEKVIVEAKKIDLFSGNQRMCILQSPADSDAFQSGRCAKHNGRPETMYF